MTAAQAQMRRRLGRLGERLVAAGALVRDRRGSRGRARVQDIARVNTEDLLNRGSRGEREREGRERHPAASREQPGEGVKKNSSEKLVCRGGY